MTARVPRRNLNVYLDAALYTKGADCRDLMTKNLAEHHVREAEMIAEFASRPGEDRRVTLETNVGILCDSFMAAEVMDSKREGGNAVLTALTHILARYMAFSVETGSQPSAVMAAIGERLRQEFNREMGDQG